MAIKNGEIVNADEIMNMHGKIFQNQTQLICNADLIGFNTNLNPVWNNLIYNYFSTDNMTSGNGANVEWSSEKDIYVFPSVDSIGSDSYVTVDEFNDNSVNTGSWFVSGGQEISNSHLQCLAGSWVESKQTQIGGSIMLRVEFDSYNDGRPGNSTRILLVGDVGSVSVYTMHAWSELGGTAGTVSGAIADLIVAGNYCYAKSNKTVNTQQYQITSLSGLTPVASSNNEYYIKLGADDAAVGTTVYSNFNWLRKYNLASGVQNISGDIVSPMTKDTNLLSNGIISAGIRGDSIVTKLSVDNGVSYTTGSNNQFIDITTAGSEIKIGFEVINGTKPSVIHNYGLHYNLY